MKYFITGATGFIGGRVAKQLIHAGHQVVALARDTSRLPNPTTTEIQWLPGDIRDKESLRGAMKGVDGVFHIAAWYKVGVRDKSPAYDINVLGTKNVLEVMAELGIRKGVYTSTLAVNSDTRGRLVDESYRYDGEHLSEYNRTKWLAHYDVAEKYIEEGLPLVIVMPGLVYGPGDKSSVAVTLHQYLTEKLLLLPKRTAFCWAHVDDTAQGHLLAMERGRIGESYIIAGPVHTLIEALLLAEQITGIGLPLLRVPPGILKGSAKLVKALEKVLPVPALYSSETLRVAAGVTYFGDNSKARRELDFQARTLKEGLTETLLWMRKNPI